MNKRLVYYWLTERNTSWPANLLERFKDNVGQHGVVYFEEGAEAEREFQSAISGLEINPTRYTLWNVSGKDLYRHPFHYLTVTTDSDYYYGQAGLVDFSTACHFGGDSLACKLGARQKQKILFDPLKSKKREFLNLPILSDMFLISRRVRDLFAAANLTGYKLTPCLLKGMDYSVHDLDFTTHSEELERNAPCFQLTITAKALRPPDVGAVTRIFSQCERCQTVHGFYAGATPSFARDALNDTDFQYFDEYTSANLGVFRIPNQIPVVSAKVIRLLLENKVSGLTPYLGEPPIRYGVVEVK